MKIAVRATRLALASSHASSVPQSRSLAIYRGIHKSCSTIRNKVDFRAIEAKWKTIWAAKEKEHVKGKYHKDDLRPLSPVRFSMLGIRNPSHGNERDQIKASAIKECDFFGNRLPFTTPKESDEFSSFRETDQQLQLCIQDYGLDLVRTSMAIGAQDDGQQQCNNAMILHTQQWLEQVWEAVSLVHILYRGSQADYSTPNIPEALYEPDIDDWVDSLVNETASLVHIPPREPNILNRPKEDGAKVWLAAQEALITFNSTNEAKNMKRRLDTLTREIIKYNSASYIEDDIQYYAARILINVIASFAPSFAEECWVLLHYGSLSVLGVHPNALLQEEVNIMDDEDGETTSLEEVESILAEAEEEWYEVYRLLPRQRFPETLPSLFELCLPVPASTETVRSMKQQVKACD
ncbi:MAG: hypothetical protein Q9184_003090 [Pyrenodesmia sp. 2 TL-2023]